MRNDGHVPFRWTCHGVGLNDSPDPWPRAACGKAIYLNPGATETLTNSWDIPMDQAGKDHYVRAALGNVDEHKQIWVPGSGSVLKAVYVPKLAQPAP